jgi:hypothetical protein
VKLLNTRVVSHLNGDTIMMQKNTAGQEEKKDTESLSAVGNKLQFYSQCDSVMSGGELKQIYQNSCQIDFTDPKEVYPNKTQSPDTRHMYPNQTQSPDTIPVYPSQSQSPDTCQTSQVSSSVSESLLYRLPGRTDNQDSNWDINDPDIPARIEQYVSSCVCYLYYTNAWLDQYMSSSHFSYLYYTSAVTYYVSSYLGYLYYTRYTALPQPNFLN